MHKKPVLNVTQKTSSFLVKQDKRNNDSDVKRVKKLSYGKIFKTKDIAKSIGSNYGLKKVTAFVNYANYLDTVILNLKALKNIGLTKLLKCTGITKKSNTSFMMEPIFIKMGA